jgi:hypothetical protein
MYSMNKLEASLKATKDNEIMMQPEILLQYVPNEDPNERQRSDC